MRGLALLLTLSWVPARAAQATVALGADAEARRPPPSVARRTESPLPAHLPDGDLGGGGETGVGGCGASESDSHRTRGARSKRMPPLPKCNTASDAWGGGFPHGEARRGEGPWYRGLRVDVLAGFSGFPSSVSKWRVNMDRFVGVRAGWQRQVRFFNVGGEFTWRSTGVVNTGAAPFWPQSLAYRLAGDTPQQTLRQQNQAALGALAGARWRRMDYFIEAFASAGLTASYHTFLVTLERALPYNRSFFTAGAYLGTGFMTGLDPISLRMDVLFNPQVGRPPWGTQFTYAACNLSVGVAL